MKVEVSLGELVDKVSILSIKLEKINNTDKLANVRKEYDILSCSMLAAGVSEDSEEYTRLIDINRQLWEIEDRIRELEAAGVFDDTFVQLARSVYFTNDKRFAIKQAINNRYGSELVEEKEYSRY